MVLSTILGPRGHEARLAHALRALPLFKAAPSRDLVALWRKLVEVRIADGEVVCRQGEPGDSFYIIQAGCVEVRLSNGRGGVALYRLNAGDCFGEMALLTGQARSADVVAVEDTVLWALGASDFERVLNDSPALLRALNRSLAERLAMATLVIQGTEGADAAGLRFGPYRAIAQIGAGGMSVVYSAVREDDEMAVALKVLPAAWGAAPEFRARLEREAEILRHVDHPAVIRLLNVGAVDARLGGGTYMAMEWLPHALDRVLRAQFPEPLTTGGALRVARAVAQGLAAVHAAGILHRDVKPSNILLRANGQPVLTDFGLAAALTDLATSQRLTPNNVLVGTADYLAPERIADETVDGRADLYSLGIVLYEMLTGFVPFAGRDPIETLRAHAEEPVPGLPASVPALARAIVERALQKKPADRFASADEMATALDRALAED
jgi:serine/threonine protein kinase